jgi:hypothetical protein
MWLYDLADQVLNPEKVRRCLLMAALPALLFYLVMVAFLNSVGFEVMEILRDPAQQSGQSSFLGFLSNVGIWLWVSSAAICLFHAVTSRWSVFGTRRELILLVGLLSLVLAIDDFFMIHDRYVDQKICYLTYAVLASALLLRHHQEILRIDGFAFLAAGSLLALSIVTDVVQGWIPLEYSQIHLFEEGFKFSGAAVWLFFSTRLALDLQSHPRMGARL